MQSPTWLDKERRRFLKTPLSLTLQGLTRAMQGPTLEDIKEQTGVQMDDFAIVFALGTISFPLGNLASQ